MALLRLFRTETARLLIMGFLMATAGIALTQPGAAQADTPVAATAAATIAR